MDTVKLKEKIISLCSLMTISGYENRAVSEVKKMYGEYFDEIRTDAAGNVLLIKRCGKENAPMALIDAHFDEIGMIVTDVLEGGFLRLAPIGGVDPCIMQAADVCVWGKEMLRGVVVSTPPHLRSGADDKLPPVDELMVDVGLGYTLDELKEMIPLGTPVGFAPLYSELQNGKIAGKSFDDKACGAIAIEAVAELDRAELACDVCVMLSRYEETGAFGGGVAPGVFSLDPDYAMVIDVNLASVPDVSKRETVDMDKGISISMSSSTSRKLTRMTVELCKSAELPHTVCAAPAYTGTNAMSVNLVGEGVPVVDIGLPLKSMHTYNEVISLEDCVTLAGLVAKFVTSEEIARAFCEKEEIIK